MTRRSSTARIARIIRKALDEGHVVDIAGFGSFRPTSDGFDFIRETNPTVFIAYVQEDLAMARRLFNDLQEAGCQPWLDKENLLPGQNWPRAIERAIEISDFFIPCLSRRAISKRGVFQSELRYALDCARRLPIDSIFVIPARLDDCVIPREIEAHLHRVDLFSDWRSGLEQVRRTIAQEMTRRRSSEMPWAS